MYLPLFFLRIYLEPLILYRIPTYWQCIDIVGYPCIVANPLPDPSHSMLLFVDDRLPCILSHSTHIHNSQIVEMLVFLHLCPIPACVVFYFFIYYIIYLLLHLIHLSLHSFLPWSIFVCLKKVGCLWPWAPKFSKKSHEALQHDQPFGRRRFLESWGCSNQQSDPWMRISPLLAKGYNRGNTCWLLFFCVKIEGFLDICIFIMFSDIYEQLNVWDLWAYSEFTKEWCHWSTSQWWIVARVVWELYRMSQVWVRISSIDTGNP